VKSLCNRKVIKQCLGVVADTVFPNGEHTIPGITLSRFTFGRELEEFSKRIEEALEMKTTNVQ
jgi:hypothetical protein